MYLIWNKYEHLVGVCGQFFNSVYQLYIYVINNAKSITIFREYFKVNSGKRGRRKQNGRTIECFAHILLMELRKIINIFKEFEKCINEVIELRYKSLATSTLSSRMIFVDICDELG